jgi:sporulation integral membrane protein YtvI
MIKDVVGSFTDNALSAPTDSPILEELGEIGEKIAEGISSALATIGEKGSAALASAVGKIAMGTPKAVIGTVVAVVASFYLCTDLENIKSYLLGFFSEESQKKVRGMLSRVLGGIKAYAVAYFWLFVITFAELYLGLFLLGRRYALLLALLLALIDMLPLFGAGVFVVPWGIFLILSGDTASGVGLFILLGVMSITRQIVEPRLVGKKLGIHPLASLSSMYVGFRIFGFWGMILAPVAVLVVKEMRKAKEQGIG